MKLWIRNMWKHGFYEVNGVVAREVGDKWEITDCRSVLPLGEYATRERCLEIIDEIQKLLEMADPTKAFLNIECDGLLDYNDFVGIIEFTRKHNAGYVPNGKVELIMPNVITYQMPEK